jgi:hypothetical protein
LAASPGADDIWCLCFSQLTGGLPQAGFRARYDLAVVVPNDGDLEEPVRFVREDLDAPVGPSTLTPAAPHPAAGFDGAALPGRLARR